MNRKELSQLVAVARGQEAADLLLTNARIVNTFTAGLEEGNVAIFSGVIAGIGDYRLAAETIDLKGKYLCPGLLDGHTHVESSLLSINQYARAVVPHGTTAVVTDFHELVNVCGLDGARSMLDASDSLPLDVFFMIPSCVPATRLETSGACISASDVLSALSWKHTLGLGEVMNFPGVLNSDPDVLVKLSIATGRVIDGHAPGLRGNDLNAYLATGPASDHECVSREEGETKLRRGMWLMIREGSSEKNLESLLPIVNDRTFHRCFFVVDDRSCFDLLRDGDIDAVVRKAIRLGLDPVRAIQMATINPAQYFGLRHVGAVAPGFVANLIVVSHVQDLDIDMVFYRGRLVARNGEPLFVSEAPIPHDLRDTVHVKPFGLECLAMPAEHGHQTVIQVVPGQIVTRKITQPVKVEDGQVIVDLERDLLKVVVVERHRASGNIGRGLVQGFGLKRGAMASSVAHDSHNIVAVGTNDADIVTAVGEVIRLQGGLVIAAEGRVLEALPLPVAGLLADDPADAVAARLARLQTIASDLGCAIEAPFSVLSFLALPVIPEIRLTDLGLIDVETSQLVD